MSRVMSRAISLTCGVFSSVRLLPSRLAASATAPTLEGVPPSSCVASTQSATLSVLVRSGDWSSLLTT